MDMISVFFVLACQPALTEREPVMLVKSGVAGLLAERHSAIRYLGTKKPRDYRK